MFSWSTVQKQVFGYCSSCSTLPVYLVKASMFPPSPVNPLGAVRFEFEVGKPQGRADTSEGIIWS
ncbi:unnamed protein product [Rhizopus stolonifer]